MSDDLWRLRNVEVDLHNTLDLLADLQMKYDELMEASKDWALELQEAKDRADRWQKACEGVDEECKELRHKLMKAEGELQYRDRKDRLADYAFAVEEDDYRDHPWKDKTYNLKDL